DLSASYFYFPAPTSPSPPPLLTHPVAHPFRGEAFHNLTSPRVPQPRSVCLGLGFRSGFSWVPLLCDLRVLCELCVSLFRPLSFLCDLCVTVPLHRLRIRRTTQSCHPACPEPRRERRRERSAAPFAASPNLSSRPERPDPSFRADLWRVGRVVEGSAFSFFLRSSPRTSA